MTKLSSWEKRKYWSDKHPSCHHCGQVAKHHKAQGFCTRCYPIIKLSDSIKSMEQNNPQSIDFLTKRLSIFAVNKLKSTNKFDEIKIILLNKVNARLDILQSQTKKCVTGFEVEGRLRQVGNLCNMDGDFRFYNSAKSFDELDVNARLIIYKYLSTILMEQRFYLRISVLDW